VTYYTRQSTALLVTDVGRLDVTRICRKPCEIGTQKSHKKHTCVVSCCAFMRPFPLTIPVVTSPHMMCRATTGQVEHPGVHRRRRTRSAHQPPAVRRQLRLPPQPRAVLPPRGAYGPPGQGGSGLQSAEPQHEHAGRGLDQVARGMRIKARVK
jgi:hypothetical protein